MNLNDVLCDALGRTREVFHEVLSASSLEDVHWKPTPVSNSIAWLVWHAGREIDTQIAALAGSSEVWDEWFDRFALNLPKDAHGYGQSAEEASRVVVEDVALLSGYYDACVDAAVSYFGKLGETDLDEIIDRSWTPAVTRGVRIVSIIDDAAQHAGQAAYLRGLIDALDSEVEE